MTRLLRIGTGAATLIVIASAIAATTQAQIDRGVIDPAVMPAEFPPADAPIWTLLRTGVIAKLARQALAAEPDSPRTLDLLIRAHRTEDAIVTVGRIVDRHPGDIEAALQLANALFLEQSRDPLRFDRDVVHAIVARATASLGQLPREDAARAARAALTLEIRFVAAPDDRAKPLTDFVVRWNGTEAALSTEVDVIASRHVDQQKLDALEAFARAHPHTAAAAKAQYLRGFDLAQNGSALGTDRPGANPLERFTAVHAIVEELESGRYPPCEWVDKAPELIVGFFASKPTYTDETFRIMRETYERFAKTHFKLDGTWPARSGVGYVVASKLANVYESRGNAVAAVEELLNTWAEDPSIGESAHYLLAFYYLDRAANAPSPDKRADFAARARRTLKTLYERRDGVTSQRALAVLAAIEQQDRAYAAAVGYLKEYIQKYPESTWSWVAMLRLGKALEATDAWDAASCAYADAASKFSSNPVASALAAAYTGGAYEAMGRFDEALGEYERALKRWDDDYGVRYSVFLTRPVRAGEPFATSRDESVVDKTTLSQQAGELKRTLQASGGRLLAQARWEFRQGHLDAAIATAMRVLREYPQSAIVSDARSLSHHAQVDRALESGNIGDLDALAREPYDYWIAASKMARAARLWREGAAAAAEALMMEALTDTQREQRTNVPALPRTELEQDILAIRNLVFRPKGDGVFAGSRWELNSLSPHETPFFIVNPNTRVTRSTGEVVTLTLRQPLRDYANVVFLDSEQLAFFDRLLAKVGGTERRQPTAVMEVPNQPVGGSMQVLALLQKFFPARPGHWGGWMMETFPIITNVEFLDAARTKAGVHVTVGYEGATLVFDKQNGTWVFREMTRRWIM